MNRSIICSTILTALLFVVPADAATITNNEASDQKVTVLQGDASEQVAIAPGQTMEGICSASCTLRLSNGDEFDLEPEDTVSMEDGSLFVEPQSQGSDDTNQEKPINQ